MPNFSTIVSSSLILALPLALAGCTLAQGPAEPATASAVEGTEANGVAMNGVAMNGISLQGPELNGPILQGTSAVTLVWGSLDDEPIAGLGVQASGLVGTVQVGGHSVAVAGTDFVDAELVLDVPALDAEGDALMVPARARIVDVEPIGSTDVLAHELLLLDSTGSWVDPCDNGGLGMILVAGDWDLESGDKLGESGVTLACRGNVLAKCVEWGYEPWLSSTHAELHQACTRMARADYCGDGTPMTVNGTQIDVYDALSIQGQATRWPVEAEWAPWGATCIGDGPRRLELLELAEPSCFAAIEGLPSCGDLVGRAKLANGYTD